MSLRVWLPLNGDLHNQGLTSVTLSSGTPTYTNGKLGQCLNSGTLNFNVSDNLITSLGSTNIYSICCWCKNLNTSTSSRWVFALSGGSGTARGLWENNSTIYRHWAYSGSGVNVSTSINTIDGNWHHLCFTSSGSNVKLYVDGIYQSEITNGSTTAMTYDTFQLNATDYNLNDFRIYNHCLSESEVKKLAQGLILHYPLNRQGLGQENLLPVSDSTIINSTQSFEFQGWVQNFYTKTWMNEHLTPGKQYTLSYTVTCLSIPDSTYTFKENRPSPILVHQGGGWSQITTTSDGIKDTNMSVGQSRDYKCTFTFATATENYEYYGLCGYTALYRNSSSNTQYAKFRIDNLKLEEGSIVTPWCPNSSDELATTMGLNSTIEYDCSGYGNNGTRVGTLTWSSDTPKYNVSTQFNGSSYIKTLPGQFTWSNYDNLTIAAWMKPTATPSNWTGSIGIAHDGSYANKAVAISNYGGKFTIHIPSGAAWGTTQSTYTIPLNTWHHCVATVEGTVCKMYVDGVLNKTFTIDWGTATNHANPQIEVGVDLPGTDEIYNGYYSDVRIYATALSASDVKSLYQNSAYIDSSGNVYGAVYSEV